MKMIVYITNTDYIQGAKETLVEKTKLVASAFEVRVVSEIPKNGSGKILYSQLDNQ